MAYIPINDVVLREVSSSISNKRPEPPQIPLSLQSHQTSFLTDNVYTEEFIEVAGKYKAFFNCKEGTEFIFKDEEGTGMHISVTVGVNAYPHSFMPTTMSTVPANFTNAGFEVHPSYRYPRVFVDMGIHGDKFPNVKATLQRQKEITEHKRETERIVEEVRKFLVQFGSIGAALKVWPALWDFIPENLRERHRKATASRSKPATPKITVVPETNETIDALTTEVMIRNLSTGGDD